MKFHAVMLICARATESLTIRDSNFDRKCFHCGERVMIAPSGQRVLAEVQPTPTIICLQCSFQIKEPRLDTWAASPEEMAAERRNAIPNLYRRRN